MSFHAIDASYVVRHCEIVSTEHKMLAAGGGQRRQEHMAKAQAIDEIADHFREATQAAIPTSEIDAVARKIDAATFAAYDALLIRLAAEGSDETYALRVAETTYGHELAEARGHAVDSLTASIGNDPEDAGYDQGIAAAIAWHEAQAASAERSISIETVDVRKAKFRQRADRHRLYAKRMKIELEAAREAMSTTRREARERAEPSLPFGSASTEIPSEGIPLAVQARFLKKGEVFDDEGHA